MGGMDKMNMISISVCYDIHLKVYNAAILAYCFVNTPFRVGSSSCELESE